MKTQISLRISGMFLLAFALGVAALVLVYALQHPNLWATLATVSWNGSISMP